MGKLLWTPSEQRIQQSNMYRFMKGINEQYHMNFTEYTELYEWSIQHIPEFWAALWDFAGVIASKPYDDVVDDLGLREEVQYALTILEEGTSADRQLAVYNQGHDLRAVGGHRPSRQQSGEGQAQDSKQKHGMEAVHFRSILPRLEASDKITRHRPGRGRIRMSSP